MQRNFNETKLFDLWRLTIKPSSIVYKFTLLTTQFEREYFIARLQAPFYSLAPIIPVFPNQLHIDISYLHICISKSISCRDQDNNPSTIANMLVSVCQCEARFINY